MATDNTSTNAGEFADTSEQLSGTLDPLSDPSRPRLISFHDVSAAAFRIRGSVVRTPCSLSHISEITGMELYFKREFMQYTGSYKERGAKYAIQMLPEDRKQAGIITAASANFAMAMSYHANRMKVPLRLIVSNAIHIAKIEQCKNYGADVSVVTCGHFESREMALREAVAKELTYISEIDHPHVIAGNGTLGLEIVEQMEQFDALVVPIESGSLLAGMAVAVKSLRPNVTIIGVEPERSPIFTAAHRAGRPVTIPEAFTLADCSTPPMIGVNAFATASPLIDKVVTVSEEMTAIAILRLVEMEKAVIEGSGALALAAILAGLLPELKGRKVVVPLTGGNIDITILGRCLERGLAADGRLVKMTVVIHDKPNGIAELTKTISDVGVTIRDIIHERAWIRTDVFNVRVKVIAETRDKEHARQLEAALKQHYAEVYFNLGLRGKKGPKEGRQSEARLI